MRDKGVGNYANTGGFNRLAGRSSAPGSCLPDYCRRRWRMLLLIIGAVLLLPGAVYLIF